MNTGLSIFVTFISLGTIFGCAALLLWCIRDHTGVEEGKSMGHTFDGIEELNNPIPKWWSIMFFIMCVIGLIYLLLFPGLGNFKGLLGWKSSVQDMQSLSDKQEQLALAKKDKTYIQYVREKEKADKIYGAKFKQLAYESDGTTYKPVEAIAQDSDALKVGRRLFAQNCALCHGLGARGGFGFPNLTHTSKQWGSTPSDIKKTLMQGRQAAMPAWLDVLGEDGVRQVVSYVMNLSGRRVNEVDVVKGEKLFMQNCVACHTQKGTGNTALGAPNLTDNIWLYGGTRKRIEETIKYGRNGVMPAWGEVLGEDKVQILSAYVVHLQSDNKNNTKS